MHIPPWYSRYWKVILILKIRKVKFVGGGSIDIQLGKDPQSPREVGRVGRWGEGGSIDIQLRKESCRWVGRGGGVDCKDSTQERKFWSWRGGQSTFNSGKDPWRHCKDYLWGMGILGGRLTVNLERICEDIAKVTSGNVDPRGSIDSQLGKDPQSPREVGREGTGGGSIDSQLGKDLRRHCKDYLWLCWSWGLINSQLGKDLQRHCKDYLWLCRSWGDRSTVNLERICKDIAKITSGNVDPGGQWTVNLERICEDIARITSGNVDPWGGQSTVNLERICKDIAKITSGNVDPGGVNWQSTWKGSTKSQRGGEGGDGRGVNWQSTWKGSTKTLQGLPLTMLILGGQLTVNLERMHKDIARITSDNVDPGGLIDSQLGKDLQRHCKDYLWQCWSWGGWSTVNLERIHKDIARITSDNVDPEGVNQQSTWKESAKILQRLPLTMLILEGVNRQSTWKGSAKTLQGLPLTMLILGGQSTVNLERIHKDIAKITSDNVDPRVVNWQSTWKGSMKTLQGLPLTMLVLGGQLTVNLERICKDIARITSDNVDPGGGQSTVNLERIHKDIARITSDNVDPRVVNWQSTWKGSMKTLQGLPLTMLVLGGQLTVNLERICKDIARSTSDNVDPGGLINSQCGKDLWRHCKDYL